MAASYYYRRMRIVLSRRASNWLRRKAWPRFTATAMILASIGVAYATFCFLSDVGIHSLGVKFGTSFSVGYATLIVLQGAWLLSRKSVEATELMSGADAEIVTAEPGSSSFDRSMSEIAERGASQSARESDSVLGLIIMAGLLGILFASFHFIYHGPWYLGKLMVDSGKVRHKATPSGQWFDFLRLPLGQSWPIGLVTWLHCTSVGFLLDSLQPK